MYTKESLIEQLQKLPANTKLTYYVIDGTDTKISATAATIQTYPDKAAFYIVAPIQSKE